MKLQIFLGIAFVFFTAHSSAEMNQQKDRTEQIRSDAIQARGEDILQTMAKVNRYWLVGPASEVKNYSYEFLLDDEEPKTIEVRTPVKTRSSSRQGISYYSVLHKLASDPSCAEFQLIEEGATIIRLDFTLKDSVKVACGNGISGSWRGYFSRGVDRGSVWMDAEKMVPIKTVCGELKETFSNYVDLGQSHYVPLGIKIDKGDMHFDWRFSVYEPGLWLFDMAHYRYKGAHRELPIMAIEDVTVNAEDAQQSQSPVVAVAQTDESTSLQRLLSESRKKTELVMEANHAWLLPSLEARKGLVYQYHQEEPYLETIMFDDQGHIMAQLDGHKESPDVPTGQLFYQPNGGFIRTQFDETFVRPARISDEMRSSDKPLVEKDRRVRSLATGLNFDCALTRMAREPENFGVQYEPVDDTTYRLILTASSRDSKIFTGTMLAFTSWAYMHDIRYKKAEVIVDAETNQPLSEKDYDANDNLVGSYIFSDYLRDPGGGAPGRIQAVIPSDHSLEMDAVFEFVRPGLWLLKTCHSEFRGKGGGSTGRVEVVSENERSFQPLTQLLARLEKTAELLSKVHAADEGRVAASLGPDNTIPVYARAVWSSDVEKNLYTLLKEAGENDQPVISVVPSHYRKIDTHRFKVDLELFSNIYWKEFETTLTIELLDSSGEKLAEVSISTRARTEGSPRLTTANVEFSDIEDVDVIDQIAVTATVERETARHLGSRWFTYTNR